MDSEKKLESLFFDNTMPSEEFNPLAGPVAEIPNVQHTFYLDELLDWIRRDSEIPFDDESREYDQRITLDCYPGEPSKNYRTETWKTPLSMEDFLNGVKEYNDKPLDFHFFLTRILLSTKAHPHDFISKYAANKSIEKILNGTDYSGEITCIELLIKDLNSFNEIVDRQFIPKLVHIRDHCHLMSHDLRKVEVLDIRVEEAYYEFAFSKKTSEAFTHALTAVLGERKSVLEGLSPKKDSYKVAVNLPGATKERCREILRQLGYENKQIPENLELGMSEVLLLFEELKKAGIIDKDVSNSNLVLAIVILTGYKFDELYNRAGKATAGDDIAPLFKNSTDEAIKQKLNKLKTRLERVVKNIDSSRNTLKIQP